RLPDGPGQPRAARPRDAGRRQAALLRDDLGGPVHLGRDGRHAEGALRTALRGRGRMIESLGALPRMIAAPTRSVIEALEAAGGPGCARFVGGCVRNAVLKRKIEDIDIATTLTPDRVTT